MHWLSLLAIVLFPCIAWSAAADLFVQLNKLSMSVCCRSAGEGAKKEGEVMLYSSSGPGGDPGIGQSVWKKVSLSADALQQKRRQPAVYYGSADGICRKKIFSGHLLGRIFDNRPDAQGTRHVGALYFTGNSGDCRRIQGQRRFLGRHAHFHGDLRLSHEKGSGRQSPKELL